MEEAVRYRRLLPLPLSVFFVHCVRVAVKYQTKDSLGLSLVSDIKIICGFSLLIANSMISLLLVVFIPSTLVYMQVSSSIGPVPRGWGTACWSVNEV